MVEKTKKRKLKRTIIEMSHQACSKSIRGMQAPTKTNHPKTGEHVWSSCSANRIDIKLDTFRHEKTSKTIDKIHFLNLNHPEFEIMRRAPAPHVV
jgi:hypothetical protein